MANIWRNKARGQGRLPFISRAARVRRTTTVSFSTSTSFHWRPRYSSGCVPGIQGWGGVPPALPTNWTIRFAATPSCPRKRASRRGGNGVSRVPAFAGMTLCGNDGARNDVQSSDGVPRISTQRLPPRHLSRNPPTRFPEDAHSWEVATGGSDHAKCSTVRRKVSRLRVDLDVKLRFRGRK
jgi:hypothetical protein